LTPEPIIIVDVETS